MSRVLSVAEERFPIAGAFTISRGSKTEAVVIVLHDQRRSHTPGAANAFPTGATARPWRACAPRSSRGDGDFGRNGSEPADLRDDGGRRAQRGRLRDVGPGGQDRGSGRPTGLAQRLRKHSRRPSRCRSTARSDGGPGPRQAPPGRCSRSRSAAQGDVAPYPCGDGSGARSAYHPRCKRRLD